MRGLAMKIDARHQALAELITWRVVPDRDAIAKNFQFVDFAAAWQFMSAVAVLAEQMDHHPEWKNVYNRVEVVLTTHDAGGVTERDVTMAKAMDRLEQNLLS